MTRSTGEAKFKLSTKPSMIKTANKTNVFDKANVSALLVNVLRHNAKYALKFECGNILRYTQNQSCLYSFILLFLVLTGCFSDRYFKQSDRLLFKHMTFKKDSMSQVIAQHRLRQLKVCCLI